MSSNLYWRPFGYGEKPLSDELKRVLQNSERYNRNGIANSLSADDLPYFEALKDAGIKDADKIVAALDKYDEIEIKEVF